MPSDEKCSTLILRRKVGLLRISRREEFSFFLLLSFGRLSYIFECQVIGGI